MSYPWSNERRLDLLSVEGEGNVLHFSTEDEEAQVFLNGNDIERVVFKKVSGEPVEIAKNDAHAIVVGEGNAMRDVYHFLKPGGPAPTMRLGITKHRGIGTWSSLPHDFELNTEPGFEEVFFYLIEGASERGIQVGKGVWFNGSEVDTVWPVNTKHFGTVPMGYHPVVAEPGANVSYVWVYLAKYPRWEKVK